MSDKKILVCSISCWNQKTGSDTFSTLLEGYGADRVANVYFSESVPDSSVCARYFRISENAVVKSVINRKIATGAEVSAGVPQTENAQNEAVTARRYRRFSNKRHYVLLMGRELLWFLGRWKTPALDRFLEEFAPDTVFFAMEGYIYHDRVVRYILKKTGAKGVGYFWDDNFTYRQSGRPLHNVYRFFQRCELKKLAKLCSEFFAISPKTKREADAFFGIDCQLLTKPIDFERAAFEPRPPQHPIRMLYTGKLAIDRDKTIRRIGEALDKINRDGVKIELDVYTTSHLSEEARKALSPHVHVKGAIPQSEVAQVQREADVLLFAEAIDGPHSRTARLSFSTKLTDYFRSGKCILAVGCSDVAPMEYLREEDAALVATDEAEIEAALRRLTETPEIIGAYAQKAFACGQRNHDKKEIQKRLFETLNR